METNPECLLKGANNIAFTDKFIFVSDKEKLIQFDKSGRYIRKISSKGRGPREYLQLCDYQVDERNGRIYILDAKKLLVYDMDGNFVESSCLPFISFYFISIDVNNLIYYSENIPGQTKDTAFS
jgi:hypothetical protein